MPCSTDAVIRPLEDSDLPLANKWAIDEGWNPGHADGLLFNSVDPGSFMGLEVNGVLVGATAAVKLSPDHGFVGFFVIAPEHRGKARYGWLLVQACLARLEKQVIGSEAVLEFVRSYSRYGFKPHYATNSYCGVAPASPPGWRTGIGPASDSNIDEIVAYDTESAGMDRGAILRAWFKLPQSLGLIFRREGKLCGIGMARRCHCGVRIGPLQADDPEAAEALFDALSGLAPGESISIDASETNPDAVELALAKGLRLDSSTARVYRGTPPATRLVRIYGLVSYSLG